jgi:hypothetical protein
MFVCLGTALSPTDAMAKKVYSPIVEEGELELEYSLDYTIDNEANNDGSARHQYEIEYAPTDRLMLAAIGDFRKWPGQSYTYQGLKAEAIYQLFEQGQYWLDAGLYLEYIRPDDALHKNNALEVKVLLEKEWGKLTNTLNIVVKRELGGQSADLGYALRTKYRKGKAFEPAIEAYGSLGKQGDFKSLQQQSHHIGPVFIGKLQGGFGYEVGYLFGVTKASDNALLKVILGYEF